LSCSSESIVHEQAYETDCHFMASLYAFLLFAQPNKACWLHHTDASPGDASNDRMQ